MCTSNSYSSAMIKTDGYMSILIFDYCTQWGFSTVNSGDVLFDQIQNAYTSAGEGAGCAHLILVSNVTTDSLVINRTGVGTGKINTPIAYGF